jgi:N-methylhydantoinase A
MSAFHGRTLGIADLLSFDMGGTTAKGALVRGGKPLKKYGMEVARAYQFKAGSGYPVRVPTIDMIEIGAGGGSIAELDARGLIRVGPRSAGASPGPVCYGRGGIEPTLTDANLLLGYLDPLFFLGGRMRLDVRSAERAIMERVGRPLGLELVRAAWGIHEIINEDVARAFRVHASERGFDYRRSSMIAFGGCGPMHAVRIARKLGVPRVILPASAGVMSALGLLISPLSFETVRSLRMDLAALDKSSLQAAFRPLVDQVSGFLEQAGVRRNSIRVVRKLDMRYEGQATK